MFPPKRAFRHQIPEMSLLKLQLMDGAVVLISRNSPLFIIKEPAEKEKWYFAMTKNYSTGFP